MYELEEQQLLKARLYHAAGNAVVQFDAVCVVMLSTLWDSGCA